MNTHMISQTNIGYGSLSPVITGGKTGIKFEKYTRDPNIWHELSYDISDLHILWQFDPKCN